MKEITEKAISYLDRFEALAVEYTPKVIDAGLMIARIEGVQNIIYGIFGGLLFFLSIYVPYKFRKVICENNAEPFVIFIIIISALVGLAMFSALMNIWNWVAILSPELYIGYKIIN